MFFASGTKESLTSTEWEEGVEDFSNIPTDSMAGGILGVHQTIFDSSG